jgi:acyl-CoA synthetase (NDP forming)
LDPENSLDRLFSPRSVAIVGASANLESISGRPLKLLKRYGFEGTVYPVNPKYESIEGFRCYSSLDGLPEVPDVVLVGVRASLVPSVLEDCARLGVKYAVVFSSGFAESEGVEAQEEIVRIAKAGGVRILGPNCQGLVNLASGIPLSFSASLDTDRRPTGHVAYVSQSGAFGFASFAMAADAGAGFRYVVTTGNQADLDVIEIARYLAADPEVNLLLLYLEGVSSGERFLELLRFARSRDLPVAILKVGQSAVAKEAAKSHTAALTGDEKVWEAVFRQYGVLTLSDSDDVTDAARIFGVSRRAKGNRVGILSTSGGAGIIAADACDAAGLSVPSLDKEFREQVERFIPSFGSSLNPVDMTAQVINDPQGFRNLLALMEESPQIDMLFVVLSMITGESGMRMAEDLALAFESGRKPIVCCWLIDDEHGKAFRGLLTSRGVPVFSSLRRAALSLARLVQWEGRPDLPALNPIRGKKGNLDEFPSDLTEAEAKELLASYGVPITRERLCTSLSESLAAAEEIGYPVALKVMSPDIPHKTEAGIVALRVKDEEELRNTYGRILEKAVKAKPKARIKGVLVQEMVSGGQECIVGVRRDPLFGPVIAVGLGGIFVEVLQDVALRLAPVDRATVLKMLEELKGLPLLRGIRGNSPRDIDALASLVEAVSRLALSEPDLLELDVNPVMVLENGRGAVAVDALVVRKPK